MASCSKAALRFGPAAVLLAPSAASFKPKKEPVRTAYCKTFKDQCQEFDDELGRIPTSARLGGRIAIGIGASLWFGPAGLFLVPAYDATKCAFHIGIDRRDKALTDGIATAVGVASAGMACSIDAAASAAASEVSNQVSAEMTQQCANAAMSEASGAALKEAGTEAARRAVCGRPLLDGCSDAGQEVIKEGASVVAKECSGYFVKKAGVEVVRQAGAQSVQESALSAASGPLP